MARGQLVRLAAGAGLDRVGLTLGRAALIVGLALGVRPELGRLVLGRGAQLSRVDLGGCLELVGGRTGLLHDLRGLLLGEAEQLLDPGTQAGVRRPLLLSELTVRLGQLLLQRADLLAVLPYVAVYLPEVLVDLGLVVPAHHLREVAGWSVFEKIAELGVNFRLHMA